MEPLRTLPHALVATARHTARLTAIFVGLGVIGSVARSYAAPDGSAAAVPNLLLLYSSLTASEWLLFRAGMVAHAVTDLTLGVVRF